jgi:hypothetical protein
MVVVTRSESIGHLADRTADPDNFAEVLVGEDRREIQYGQRDAVDVLCQPDRDVVRHHRRGLQRHRQRAAHKLRGVGSHDAEDFVGLFALFRRKVVSAAFDVAADLVGGDGAIVGGLALHERADVFIRQRSPGHRHRSIAP